MSNFASEFTPISISTAKDKISSTDKFILFIGRPSCPYCQLFEPKLSNVARNSNLTIFYINSENSEELEDIQALRKRYGIATVPALFVSENGAAKVVCDSSLSEDDILDFISYSFWRFLCLFVNTRSSIMKQIEWVLLIIPIMYDGWKRLELFF